MKGATSLGKRIQPETFWLKGEILIGKLKLQHNKKKRNVNHSFSIVQKKKSPMFFPCQALSHNRVERNAALNSLLLFHACYDPCYKINNLVLVAECNANLISNLQPYGWHSIGLSMGCKSQKNLDRADYVIICARYHDVDWSVCWQGLPTRTYLPKIVCC